jgi:hypothetical protein
MRLSRGLSLIAMLACAAAAHGAPSGSSLSIGYAYPAGGRQGTTVEVMIGGQNLRGATHAYVSGEGVHASVTQFLPVPRREQLQELQRQLLVLARQRQGPLNGPRRGANFRRANLLAARANKPAASAIRQAANKPKAEATVPVSLPDHPMLRNLDQMSVGELQAVADRFLRWRRVQPTPAAIAQTVVLAITIDPHAPPGERELRLQTPAGLTNPLRFEVGTAPEISEHEPNGPEAPAAAPLDLPVVLNGDIMPSDVDRFPFRARRGQKLVIAAQARRLMPYLADAVPGWFQAVLALYDAKGTEVAFDDDYRFDPDPVIFYEVPQDGVYTVEIRDAIYRGREDFIYRITVGEQPFITRMFPLGSRAGAATSASIAGWNLPRQQVRLETQPGAGIVRHAAWRWNAGLSNQVAYAVDALPESNEIEPNDTVGHAQRITLPVIVNGRIGKPGDVDKFRFEGHAGDAVVAEVYARRLDSPLDSLLRLTDASGRMVAWNDDHDDKAVGLLTDQADSYLSARLPHDGAYYVQLSDAQHHGGDEYAYRLRVGPPRPDFALCVTPSAINVPIRGVALLRIHAFRRDGFDGDIEVGLKDARTGFVLSGGRIPRGRESVQMTLAAPPEPPGRPGRPGRPARPVIARPFVLQLEGRARVGAKTVSHPVVPADEMMQAFAYWHLVPAQQPLVASSRSGAATGAAELELPGGGPLRIPAGGTVQVRVKTPPSPMLASVQLELSEPPKGVTLGEVTAAPDGLTFAVQADRKAAQVGYADNLIVSAFAEMEGGPPGKKAAAQKRRVALGVLPAIPFEIVR